MYTNVHCSTVYNSKDLEPTEMPINDRLDKENVAHIHYGILCSHKTGRVQVLSRTWMNLETIIRSKLTRIENETLHVLTHKWVLNNENTQTQGGEHHALGWVGGLGKG